MSAHNLWSYNNSNIESAIEFGFPQYAFIPFTLCSTISFSPPMSDTTIGFSDSMASNATIPNGSYVLGNTAISAALYIFCTSFPPMYPAKYTFSDIPILFTCSFSSSIIPPLPQITSFASWYPFKIFGIAAIKCCIPFSYTSLPINSIIFSLSMANFLLKL